MCTPMRRWSPALVLMTAITLGAAAPSSAGGDVRQAELPAAGSAAQTAPQPEAGSAGGHAESEGQAHEGWVWPLVARLVNFGLLAGTLVYFLRKPFADYLQNRSTQIRRELVEAEALRRSSAEQRAAVEQKLKALPGEIEKLRLQGAEEIALEEARMRAAADAERDRLTDQARREIDLRVRIATQELRREAAELAIAVAADRIKKNLTPETHLRLVDRYADQVKGTRTLHD